jgi:DNA invertase Pin-like site-specific DNA recombinase
VAGPGEPYRTAVIYAAVAAVISGRYRLAVLTVPGLLNTAQKRERVHARVRDHARRAGKRAHARHAGFATDSAGGPVTVFTVGAGTGRRDLTPVQQAKIRAAFAEGGVSQRAVARRFGVAQSSVGKVVRDLSG